MTDAACKIRGFTSFLEKCLRRKVLHYNLKPLTKPGENYGSIMLSVEVKVAKSDECCESDEVHLVAKTAVTNPYLVNIFQPDLTFVKEANFYSDIIPAIELFEEMKNIPKNERIDVFIKCLGSRLSLDPISHLADADAVVLLENIKISNYKNINQRVGFDSGESIAVIRQLAKFHSLCIAMRYQERELFDTKIRPHVNAVKRIQKDGDTTMLDYISNSVQGVDGLSPKLYDDISKQLRVCYTIMRGARPKEFDTPYATVIHRDFWSINLMVKKDGSEKQPHPIEIKMYDFQLYCIGSFVSDLFLFLTTSVRSDDLRKNFKLFINVYYEVFIKTMKLVNMPLDDYTFDKMWQEIQDRAKTGLLFILYFIKLSFLDAPSTLDDISHDTHFKDEPSEEVLNKWKLVIDLFKENGLLQAFE